MKRRRSRTPIQGEADQICWRIHEGRGERLTGRLLGRHGHSAAGRERKEVGNTHATGLHSNGMLSGADRHRRSSGVSRNSQLNM